MADTVTITLRAGSEQLDVGARVASVTDDRITVEFTLDPQAHDRALEHGWFHLGPLTSGPGAQPVGSGPDVRVEAFLDPRLVRGLTLVTATPAGVAELLAKIDIDSPLRSEVSWYAGAVTQEVPLDGDDPDVDDDLREAFESAQLREGYRTAWAGNVMGSGLPVVAHLAEVIERRFNGIEPLAEQPGFRWTLTGHDASWTTTAIVDDDGMWCVLYSVVDVAATVDSAGFADQAARLNAGLLFGAWFGSADPTTIQFRSGVDVADRAGASALLDALVTRHLDIVDEYASSFW